MSCAKQKVFCLLILSDGTTILGENRCRNAQAVCPRSPGEGYEKCISICDQVGHAECDAVSLAGPKAKGARAYLIGHTYACQNCQETLFDAGVISLSRVKSVEEAHIIHKS